MAESWKWTCTACPTTGDAANLEEMDAGSRHAASHASGPFGIVPTLYIERTTEPTEPVSDLNGDNT